MYRISSTVGKEKMVEKVKRSQLPKEQKKTWRKGQGQNKDR